MLKLVELTDSKKYFFIWSGIFTVSGIIDSFIYHGQKALKKKMELGKFNWSFDGEFSSDIVQEEKTRNRFLTRVAALHHCSYFVIFSLIKLGDKVIRCSPVSIAILVWSCQWWYLCEFHMEILWLWVGDPKRGEELVRTLPDSCD